MTDSLMPLALQQQRLGIFDQFFDADQRAEDATVGYGERPTTQVFEGQLALAGLCGQVCYALFYLREVLVVGVANDGDDEPLVRGDGHAYIVVLLEKELAPLQLGVDLRESLQRPDGSLGEEAHETKPRARP